MKLLVITQKVDKDDSNLGFFCGWLKKMSAEFESLEVIALGKGECELPNNVCVHSLGKEKDFSRIRKIINFYKEIFKQKDKYDAVFVHMNPEYVVLAGWLWRLWDKPVYLWYVHKSVTWKLKCAEHWVKKIFTANDASCRLEKRDKIKIVGHGIDTDLFKVKEVEKDDKFRLLSVGRMSRVKKYENIIKAIKGLDDIEFLLISGAINKEGEGYKKELSHNNSNMLRILPGIPHEKLADHYNKADLFVHTSETGSVDKVVLEAMACELPVLSSSEAFDFLPEKFKFKKGDIDELRNKIMKFKAEGRKRYPELRRIIEERFSLNNLFGKIKKEMA